MCKGSQKLNKSTTSKDQNESTCEVKSCKWWKLEIRTIKKNFKPFEKCCVLNTWKHTNIKLTQDWGEFSSADKIQKKKTISIFSECENCKLRERDSEKSLSQTIKFAGEKFVGKEI